MAKIKTKFDIGDAPLWLRGQKICNKDRSSKITNIMVEKGKGHCNIYYHLIDNVGNRTMKRAEYTLFNTKKELLKSIE